jgi:mono/diheme cytochrome c family protein
VYDMESFGKMLDDDEIWKVIHYIKTFYKPRPTE